MTDEGGFYAVVPAGGSGTRLWPLSRAGRPKFLHHLTGSDRTLLQATIDRLAPFAPAERTYVVTGVAHAAGVSRQLPALPTDNILVEPSPRDSCAAIGLAAMVIARRDPDAIMGSFAADHLVRFTERFHSSVRQAIDAARAGYLTTIGITPTEPETGYGYLRCTETLDGGPAKLVGEFKEKPSHEVAVEYVESGKYLWNAGMFVWSVRAFLAELARQQPELHDGLSRVVDAWDSPQREEAIGEIWPTLPKISVDYAVMEGAARAGRVATVPGSFGWTDVGDFHTLGVVLPMDDDGNVVVRGEERGGEVLAIDAHDTVVVPRSGRLVAALGVHDLVVVDTNDAVLVCPRNRAQDVKKLVDRLKERGERELI
ncbi:mannose-1-phosphate guanylyltransferase [Actinocatenispora comari]|uniref:mannose-1-phosphate guanylyltransferase n=1 Tax=Actinocatenispora comari TaxID=2807577 RepID=A0A8J4EKW3_9ACTN|nr:mannose-1-phosphate guanylyltransferase [Actinocatenispora comari]GIL24939.1 mannose-1-phosphate guanyltransferase [Actinocatenispora comari]